MVLNRGGKTKGGGKMRKKDKRPGWGGWVLVGGLWAPQLWNPRELGGVVGWGCNAWGKKRAIGWGTIRGRL